jgi:hypothetical protein
MAPNACGTEHLAAAAATHTRAGNQWSIVKARFVAAPSTRKNLPTFLFPRIQLSRAIHRHAIDARQRTGNWVRRPARLKLIVRKFSKEVLDALTDAACQLNCNLNIFAS